MSGTLINNYSQLDSNILEVQLTLDATRIGMHQVSLTNYDSTSESQIAAGSIIEVGGALYKFSSNETITGSPSDGTVYIMIVPATTTCTAEYTNTAPTWSDSKQGFYGTGASANYRYLEFELSKVSAVWYKKIYSNLLLPSVDYNPEFWITTNSTWTAPISKYYTIWMTGKGGNGGNSGTPSWSGGAGGTGIKRIFIQAGKVWTASFSTSEGGNLSFSDGVTTLTVANANGYSGGSSHSGMDFLIPGANGFYNSGGVSFAQGAASFYGGGAFGSTGAPQSAAVYGAGGNMTATSPYFGSGKQGVIRIYG